MIANLIFRALRSSGKCVWAALLIVVTLAVNAGQAGGIVGGTPISIESAPWTVALLLKTGTAERVRCSGVIVDPVHIVTAAHCLYQGDSQLRPDKILVRAGASNVITPGRRDALQQSSVLSFRVHPDRRVGGADVAVLRLGRALKLDGKHAEAIPLSKSGTWRSHTASLSGFGRQDPKYLSSGVLKQVDMQVDPQGSCGDTFLSSPAAAIHLCASSAFGAACYGDSGAGLVSFGTHPILIGIETSSEGRYPCRAGQRNGFAYVGAAEIWRFIGGDTRPPVAPSTFGLNVWAVPPRVGEPILCEGFAAGKARTRYVLFEDGRPIRSGSHGLSYTIRTTDVGKYFTCRGSATNAGGTSVELWKSTVVKP